MRFRMKVAPTSTSASRSPIDEGLLSRRSMRDSRSKKASVHKSQSRGARPRRIERESKRRLKAHHEITGSTFSSVEPRHDRASSGSPRSSIPPKQASSRSEVSAANRPSSTTARSVRGPASGTPCPPTTASSTARPAPATWPTSPPSCRTLGSSPSELDPGKGGALGPVLVGLLDELCEWAAVLGARLLFSCSAVVAPLSTTSAQGWAAAAPIARESGATPC